MNQILHIFKKDARHHWREILISLALLVLFIRHELHSWDQPPGNLSIGFLFFRGARLIHPALVLSWIFLILRVVHSESLEKPARWRRKSWAR